MHNNVKKGAFITFEGIDGCGKTTQINLLKDYLESKGYGVVLSREPGSAGLGEEIRKLLLHYDGYISPKCEAFMFLADRAQHIDNIVKPNVMDGKIVLCDRHIDSTIAYQGYGRGEDIEQLNYLNNIATSKFKPDLTIVCDVDVETAIKRRGDDRDRMEKEGIAFQKRVREGYIEIAKQEPNRIIIVDSSKKIDEIFEKIKSGVEQLLKN